MQIHLCYDVELLAGSGHSSSSVERFHVDIMKVQGTPHGFKLISLKLKSFDEKQYIDSWLWPYTDWQQMSLGTSRFVSRKASLRSETNFTLTKCQCHYLAVGSKYVVFLIVSDRNRFDTKIQSCIGSGLTNALFCVSNIIVNLLILRVWPTRIELFGEKR